ncbi:MAG: hypothetical protein RLZZ393_393 [Pseudomonadota bacterium]|jgi:hypothetical protein
MTTGFSKAALALTLLALAGATQAATPVVPDTLRACMRETDVLKRLACYDGEMTRLTSQAAALPAAAPATAAPAAPAPVAAVPAAAPEKPGITSRFLRSLTPAKGRNPDSDNSQVAKIASVRTTGTGLAIITLDNGQVWRQIESEAYFPLDAGDTIRIENGALGSYRLTRVEDGWKRFMRVNLVSMPTTTPSAPQATPAAAPAPAPAVAPAPKVAAPPPAPAPAAANSGGIRGFTSGLVQKFTPGSGNGKKTSDGEIGETARITALQTTGSGMAVVTLDNGQQWRQQESVAYFPLAIGDTVRIEKGALGSFRLTRVEEGWKTFMRVSRTK